MGCKENLNDPHEKVKTVVRTDIDSAKSSKPNSVLIDDGKGKTVIPDALECGNLVVNSWEQDHYETMPGKIVGIWPTEERWQNVERLRELKNMFGFNYILINFGYSFTNCYNAGYQYSNMLGGGLNVGGGYQITTQYPTVWGYYSDEPISNQGATESQVQTFKNFILSNFPSSKVMMGENKGFNADVIFPHVTDLACTRYDNWPEFWDSDQRPLWNVFKNSYGSKFSFVWIGAHTDQDSYGQLLQWTKDNGINSVWLYQFEDPSDASSNNNLESFALNAWLKGYLKRYERLWYYEYRCIKEDPCDCNRSNITDGWELIRKVKTESLRIL